MKDFKQTSEEAIREFIKEYGEKKYRQIFDKITKSASVKKNLVVLLSLNRPPNSSELLAIVQNDSFFLFSNKRNTAIAATILLRRWDEYCNSDNLISDDYKLIEILEKLYSKTSGLLW